MKPKGAGFELINREDFIWHIVATDVEFGVNGGLYVSDWVEGWDMTGKGRIYRVYDPATTTDPLVVQTKMLLAEGMERRSLTELAALLAHRDQRVRQEAQFALAENGDAAMQTLMHVARNNSNQLARLHAIWGLGQILNAEFRISNSKTSSAAKALLPLLADKDPEVRAQTAKVLGEARAASAFAGLVKLLNDESARPRFFAAIALGKLGRQEAVAPILAMLRTNADRDIYLRHAGVMGLVGSADKSALLSAAKYNSSAVRMGVLLAMRRLRLPEIAQFLHDADPSLVIEAAGAINDLPINEGMPQLAALIDTPTDSEPLLRRILNANFRLGASEHAAALAEFASSGAPAMRLHVGDLLSVTYSDTPTPLLPYEGRIKDDGTVTIPPYNQKFQAAGRSILELEQEIYNRYAPRFFATLTIAVKSLNQTIPRNRGVTTAPRRIYPGQTITREATTIPADITEDVKKPILANVRAQSLQVLGDWSKPSGRDRVTGLWRPLSPRDGKVAADALRPVLAGILQTAPDNVRIAAINTAAKLTIPESGPILVALVADLKLSPNVRAEALKGLAQLKDPRFSEALKLALADGDETVRKEANRLHAETGAGDVIGHLASVLADGTAAEKQGALIALGKVEGATADEILAQWLDKLLAGKVPAEFQFELLEAAGKRSAPAIKERLQRYEAARPKNDDLAAYRELLFGGDAAAGRQIFLERPEASCIRCHKIGGEGGEVGPALDGIGAKQNREYLLESIIYPNKNIPPGFESLLVTMKNGMIYAGIAKRETDTELEINSPEERHPVARKRPVGDAARVGKAPFPKGPARPRGVFSRLEIRFQPCHAPDFSLLLA